MIANVSYEMLEDRSGNFRIWEHPIEGRMYAAGIDPAENKRRDLTMQTRRASVHYGEDRPDFCAIAVIDMETAMHVASWHGYWPADQLATVAAAIGLYYNNALLVPEVNGPGIAVVSALAETLQYDHLYQQQYFNVLDHDPMAPKLGWRTDAVSRKILMQRVNEVLNTGRIVTYDADTIRELRTMEFDNNGTERARGKNKDDRVFAYALALAGRHQQIALLPQAPLPRPKNDSDAYASTVWRHVEKELDDSNARTRPGFGHDRGTGLPDWSPGARI